MAEMVAALGAVAVAATVLCYLSLRVIPRLTSSAIRVGLPLRAPSAPSCASLGLPVSYLSS
jgi:hypothetical protein